MTILETYSLRLREFRSDDVHALVELNSNPDVLRYVLNKSAWDEGEAKRFLSAVKSLYESYGFARWAVTRKNNDTLIGWCGLKYKPDFSHVDLGYRFMPAYWGRGFATEAGAACLQYGFEELGLNRIVASYIPGNDASAHVLKKIGMNPCGEVQIENKKYPLFEKFPDADEKFLLPAPHIETERLSVRKMHIADTRVLFALNADPEVVKYTGDKPFDSLEDAKNFFLGRIQQYEKDGMGRWIVVLKSTGETLGWCGLKREEGEVDLGFRFFKKHWGKGYATEAARASIEYGFKNLKLKKIIGRAMLLNEGSINVLEKCGMHFVAEKDFLLHSGAEYEIMG